MAYLFSFFLLVSHIWAQDTTAVETTTTTTSTTTTLVPSAPADGTTKTATFTTGLVGTITATQTSSGTKFTVNLAYPDGTTASTQHKYHIHDTTKNPLNCDDDDDHYDPYELEDAADYNCDPSDPTTCYLGDLSGKFGALNIPTPANGVQFTDGTVNVNELTERGIVVHVAQLGADRLACASFVESAAVNADGSVQINSAETNAGGVFLMWLVFLLAIGYCTYALWNIGTSEAKEHDKAFTNKVGKFKRQMSSRFGSIEGLDDQEAPAQQAPPPVPAKNPFNDAPSAPANPFTSEPSPQDSNPFYAQPEGGPDTPMGRQDRIDTTSTVATVLNPTPPQMPPPSSSDSRPLPSRPGLPSRPLPPKPKSESKMNAPPVPNRHPSTVSEPPELPKREPPTPPEKRMATGSSEFVDVEVHDEGETRDPDDFQSVDIGQDIHY